MSINYKGNEFGNIALADGTFVRLVQQAYNDNHGSEPAWFASGYLSTEDADEESGPTVTVRWESLGADEAEDDANWGEPVSVKHFSLGELL